MNDKISNKFIGLSFLQAFGVALYCSLVGLLLWKGNYLFGNAPSYIAPVAFLLLFIVSALICVAIVFYKPYQLFFGGKKREAVDLVILTTCWLAVFLMIALSLAALVK